MTAHERLLFCNSPVLFRYVIRPEGSGVNTSPVLCRPRRIAGCCWKGGGPGLGVTRLFLCSSLSLVEEKACLKAGECRFRREHCFAQGVFWLRYSLLRVERALVNERNRNRRIAGGVPQFQASQPEWRHVATSSFLSLSREQSYSSQS